MRKIVTLAATVALVFAVTPPSGFARHTLAHRVSTLETKVKGLQRRTTALRKFAHNCLAYDWAPIGWYGDGQNGTAGYVFDNDGTGPEPPFFTSALDIASSPQETTFVVAIVNPNCLGQIARRTAALRRGSSGFAAFLKRPPRA